MMFDKNNLKIKDKITVFEMINTNTKNIISTFEFNLGEIKLKISEPKRKQFKVGFQFNQQNIVLKE